MPAASPAEQKSRATLTYLLSTDAISIEELDLLYRIPDSVPISVKEWLNIDELIDVSLSLLRWIARAGC